LIPCGRSFFFDFIPPLPLLLPVVEGFAFSPLAFFVLLKFFFPPPNLVALALFFPRLKNSYSCLDLVYFFHTNFSAFALWLPLHLRIGGFPLSTPRQHHRPRDPSSLESFFSSSGFARPFHLSFSPSSSPLPPRSPFVFPFWRLPWYACFLFTGICCLFFFSTKSFYFFVFGIGLSGTMRLSAPPTKQSLHSGSVFLLVFPVSLFILTPRCLIFQTKGLLPHKVAAFEFAFPFTVFSCFSPRQLYGDPTLTLLRPSPCQCCDSSFSAKGVLELSLTYVLSAHSGLAP